MPFGHLGASFGKLGAVGRRGQQIVLSGSHSQAENTATGTAIGTLSVVNGSGIYTFTKTVDGDSAFTLTGADIKNAAEFNYGVKASHSFTVTADNGVDPIITATFTVSVVPLNLGATLYQLLFAA